MTDGDRIKAWLEEEKKTGDILQRNRHRTVVPYEWFGPDPEPCPADPWNCRCAGCRLRKEIASGSGQAN